MAQVYLFLADGFEEVEALTPVDVLRRVDVNVTTVSIMPTRHVKGARNITVVADEMFDDVDYSNADMLILPGGQPGTTNLGNYSPLKKLILDANDKNTWIAAICAAPGILGEMGLLNSP